MNMDNNSIFFTLPAADGQAGMRLDLFLRETVPAMSRARLQKLIAGGCVSLDDNIVADKDFKVRSGDSFAVFVPPAEEAEPAAENIPLDVVFEDDDLIVVNKPAGMTVHPAPGVYHGTLVNALLYHCRDNLSGVGGVKRPGIVHRIDKDTSGLVLAAQNGYAAPLLAGRVEKLYYAVVEGELPLGPGVIDAPIGRQGGSIIGRCVTPDGKPSRTEYTILKAENGLSLAACVPVTGRTHQIRVHFASIGHPLAGDDLYGGSRERIGRQALHCARQSFRVPVYTPVEGGIRVECPANGNNWKTAAAESPLPQDMKQLFGEK